MLRFTYTGMADYDCRFTGSSPTTLSGFVPTCQAKINIDEIKSLVDLMIERHFFDLPEKGYVYSTVAQQRRKLELYTIAVDNGTHKASRTFGTGEYQGRNESLPTDFAAIDDALAKMRDSAFPPHHRACGVAAGIRFGE